MSLLESVNKPGQESGQVCNYEKFVREAKSKSGFQREALKSGNMWTHQHNSSCLATQCLAGRCHSPTVIDTQLSAHHTLPKPCSGSNR